MLVRLRCFWTASNFVLADFGVYFRKLLDLVITDSDCCLYSGGSPHCVEVQGSRYVVAT